MSANLDLVRSIFAEWERGDFSRADWADPDIEFVVIEGPNPDAYRGIPAMASATRGFLAAWGGFRMHAGAYRELDDERILVPAHATAHGRTSGVATRQIRAYVFHVHNGKVTRLVAYWDRDRALADLGLEE